LNNKFLAASILSLKHTFQTGWLELNALRILILSEDAAKNLQQNLIVYMFSNSWLEQQEIAKLFQSLPLNLKDTAMNTLEIFEKRGLEKGIAKSEATIVRNLLLNTDFTLAKIAMLSEVSENFVTKIRDEIAARN